VRGLVPGTAGRRAVEDDQVADDDDGTVEETSRRSSFIATSPTNSLHFVHGSGYNGVHFKTKLHGCQKNGGEVTMPEGPREG